MIECVEKLGSKLKTPEFGNRKCLERGKIELNYSRSDQAIHAGVAKWNVDSAINGISHRCG